MNWSRPRFEPPCVDKQCGVTQHVGTERVQVNGELEPFNWSLYNIIFLSKNTVDAAKC